MGINLWKIAAKLTVIAILCQTVGSCQSHHVSVESDQASAPNIQNEKTSPQRTILPRRFNTKAIAFDILNHVIKREYADIDIHFEKANSFCIACWSLSARSSSQTSPAIGIPKNLLIHALKLAEENGALEILHIRQPGEVIVKLTLNNNSKTYFGNINQETETNKFDVKLAKALPIALDVAIMKSDTEYEFCTAPIEVQVNTNPTSPWGNELLSEVDLGKIRGCIYHRDLNFEMNSLEWFYQK